MKSRWLRIPAALLAALFLTFAAAAAAPRTAYAAGTAAVSVTAQPKAVTVVDGTKAKFTVKAAGTGLAYRWEYRKPGSTVWITPSAASAKTATLSVSARPAVNGFLYRCVITDSAGRKVTTKAVKLTVKPAAPKITAQPAAVTAADGTKAKFTVKATGTGLTYRWQYRKKGATAWTYSTASSAKTATLSVSARTAVNGYSYRCVVTNAAGSKVISSAALLTVKASPYISTQPKAVTATDGTKAKFTVKALGTGLTYRWQYRKTETSAWTYLTSSSAKTSALSVSARMAVNGYSYRCVITDGAGRKAISKAAKLTIKAAPPVITAQPKDQAAADGTPAKIKVTATGTGLTYRWQYRKPGSTAWVTLTSASAKTATLSVSARTAVHGYIYRCVITNAGGVKVTSASAHLWVSPRLTTQPQSVTAAPKEKVKFTVASGTANAVYQWQFSKAGSTGWSDCTGTAAKTPTLAVNASEAVHGRRYRCLVSNPDGYGVTCSAAATLSVSPLIKAQPKDVHALDGTKVYFAVTAEGAGLTYQWQLQKTPGGTWANLSTASSKTAQLAANVKESTDGYRYRCVVKDSGGRKAVSDAVTLRMALKLVTVPIDRTVGDGETAVFSVAAVGADLAYGWQVRRAEDGKWTDSAAEDAKTPALSVKADAGMDGYAYRCVITSAQGPKLTTEAVGLTVTAPMSGMAKAVTACWAEFGSRVTAEGLDAEQYWALTYQYPEYFYVAPVMRYLPGTVYPVYDEAYDDGDIEAFNAEVRRAVNLISSVDGDLNRAVVAYEYLLGRTGYHLGEYNDYSAAGCILDGDAACEGYAKAYYLLLNRAGVPCEVVQSDNMDHDWNLVKIGGKWYYCDVTWDDQTYAYYRFFLCSYSQFISNGHYGASDWGLATDPDGSFSPSSVNSTRFEHGVWDDPSFTLTLKDGYWYDGDRKIIQCTYPNGVRTRP